MFVKKREASYTPPNRHSLSDIGLFMPLILDGGRWPFFDFILFFDKLTILNNVSILNSCDISPRNKS